MHKTNQCHSLTLANWDAQDVFNLAKQVDLPSISYFCQKNVIERVEPVFFTGPATHRLIGDPLAKAHVPTICFVGSDLPVAAAVVPWGPSAWKFQPPRDFGGQGQKCATKIFILISCQLRFFCLRFSFGFGCETFFFHFSVETVFGHWCYVWMKLVAHHFSGWLNLDSHSCGRRITKAGVLAFFVWAHELAWTHEILLSKV